MVKKECKIDKKYYKLTRKGKTNYILDNKPVNNTIKKRLENIYIPPIYKNILLSRKNNSKIQAIVRDNKGRNQYIYHPLFTKKIENRKYKDLYPLGANINKIIRDNTLILSKLTRLSNINFNEDNLEYLLNLVIYMLLNYNFRIGSEKYEKEYNSRGITTLKNDNIFNNLNDYVKQKNILEDNELEKLKINKLKINKLKKNKLKKEKLKKELIRDLKILSIMDKSDKIYNKDKIIDLIILKYHSFNILDDVLNNKLNNILDDKSEKHAKFIKTKVLQNLNKLQKDNNGFIIDFIGKKGMINRMYDTNQYMYKILNRLNKNIVKNTVKNTVNHTSKNTVNKNNSNKNNIKYLFSYKKEDENNNVIENRLINSDMVQDYFDNKYKLKITPKMFRTWFANFYMLKYLSSLDSNIIKTIKKNELSKKLNIYLPIYVSYKLNNTPSICRKKYINNKLLKNIINNPKYYITKCKSCLTDENINNYLLKLLYK